MPRRRLFLLLIGSGLAVLIFFFVFYREKQPAYEGRNLGEWLAWYTKPVPEVDSIVDGRENWRQLTNAIAEMGTNCIPPLIRWISYEPPSAQGKLDTFLDKLPLGLRDSSLFDFMEKGTGRSQNALLAFQIMGPRAEPAIPALARIMNDHASRYASMQAMQALSYLGPKALPALVGALSDTNHPNRVAAAGYVGAMSYLGTNAEVAVPALVFCLQDSNVYLVADSIRGLGNLGLEPDIAVPAITNLLQNKDIRIRGTAISALARFGEKAKAAVPALREALNDPDPTVQTAARGSLRRIAPELGE